MVLPQPTQDYSTLPAKWARFGQKRRSTDGPVKPDHDGCWRFDQIGSGWIQFLIPPACPTMRGAPSPKSVIATISPRADILGFLFRPQPHPPPPPPSHCQPT